MGSSRLIPSVIGIMAAVVIGAYIVSNVYSVTLPEQPLFVVLAVIAVILSGTLVILGLFLRARTL